MLKIKGFQKLTLLDYPGRVAATLFTEGCNFCCPFCHNASLVREETWGEYISEEEILSHLKKRIGKLTGVCISGGEPLLHKDLPDFIRKIKALGYAVKLDTNGAFPDALERLLEDGLLDYVAMDIKNCKERYAGTAGFENEKAFAPVMEQIEKSIGRLRAGQVPFEFRTTIVKEFHEVEDVRRMGEWLAGEELFFLQAFVDSGDIISPGLNACTEKEMEEMCTILKHFVPKACLRSG